MLRYVCQRLLSSIPIVLGVLLVTFLLFHCAAGDPAALMAGKNAAARELEQVRRSLRLDRPLLWGHWRRSEYLREQDFRDSARDWRNAPGVQWRADRRDGGLVRLYPGAAVRVARQWEEKDSSARYRLEVVFRGELRVLDLGLHAERWTRARLKLPSDPASVLFQAGPTGSELRCYRVQRYQDSVLDSQFVACLRELVDVRRDPQTGRLRLSFLNFGHTLLTNEPIRQVLLQGVGPSLALMIPVFVIELAVSLFIALVSAYWRDTWLDRSLVVLSVAGMSISYLAYILVGQYYLAYYLNLFPVWGYESWRHLALPVLVGVCSGVGGSVRFYRTVFLNELYQEHVRTARAKGCSPARILLVHVLPNALIPIITRVAVVLPFLFTGSLLLESFFGIPGLGYAGVIALANADLQLLKALVVVGSLLFVAANLAADIGYALVDPRVRLK